MNCEEFDKRTKAYKDCMEALQAELEQKHEENQPTGLGDVVEAVTKATGIKKAVELFTKDGKDCGCDERKKKLNKLRFRRTPLCLNAEEFQFLDKLYRANKHTIGHTEGQKLVEIEQRVFQKKYVDSLHCAPCIRQIYNDLRIIWETYV